MHVVRILRHDEAMNVVSERLAIVTKGHFYGMLGVSNYWHWTYFDQNGNISDEIGSGYSNKRPFLLEPDVEHELVVRVVKKPSLPMATTQQGL